MLHMSCCLVEVTQANSLLKYLRYFCLHPHQESVTPALGVTMPSILPSLPPWEGVVCITIKASDGHVSHNLRYPHPHTVPMNYIAMQTAAGAGHALEAQPLF